MSKTGDERKAATDLMQQLMSRAEPLHEDLREGLRKVPMLGWCLHTPLVISVPYVEQFNAMLNQQYRMKTEACRKALEEGDWSRYIVMHEKPYRFQALADVAQRLSDVEFWELFADTYAGSENWYEPGNREMIDRWLHDMRGGWDAMRAIMSEGERQGYDALPKTISVWRGWHRRGGLIGYSWTMRANVARWFGQRLKDKGRPTYVAEGKVAKPYVLAYFDRRNEDEIFVPTVNVAIWRVRIVDNITKGKRPVVSFDFDGTLHKEMDGKHPRSFVTVPRPWAVQCDRLREAAKTARVVIVTRRDGPQLEPVLAFIQANQLPVEDVYPTYDASKAATLGRLRPVAHYDDDLRVTAECPEATTFCWIKRGGGA